MEGKRAVGDATGSLLRAAASASIVVSKGSAMTKKEKFPKLGLSNNQGMYGPETKQKTSKVRSLLVKSE